VPTGGMPNGLCTGGVTSSAEKFDQLYVCLCDAISPCESLCMNNACTYLAATSSCTTCANTNCDVELNACLNDVGVP